MWKLPSLWENLQVWIDHTDLTNQMIDADRTGTAKVNPWFLAT